jgi:hypothetical protein
MSTIRACAVVLAKFFALDVSVTDNSHLPVDGPAKIHRTTFPSTLFSIIKKSYGDFFPVFLDLLNQKQRDSYKLILKGT